MFHTDNLYLHTSIEESNRVAEAWRHQPNRNRVNDDVINNSHWGYEWPYLPWMQALYEISGLNVQAIPRRLEARLKYDFGFGKSNPNDGDYTVNGITYEMKYCTTTQLGVKQLRPRQTCPMHVFKFDFIHQYTRAFELTSDEWHYEIETLHMTPSHGENEGISYSREFTDAQYARWEKMYRSKRLEKMILSKGNEKLAQFLFKA